MERGAATRTMHLMPLPFLGPQRGGATASPLREGVAAAPLGGPDAVGESPRCLIGFSALE